MRWVYRVSPAMVVLGPLALVVAAALRASTARVGDGWSWWLAIGAGLCITLAGFVHAWRPLPGRIVASIGIGGFLAQAIAPLLDRAGLALIVMLLVGSALAAVWRRPLRRLHRHDGTTVRGAGTVEPSQVAALLALVGWFLAVVGQVAADALLVGAAAAGLLVAQVAGALQLQRERRGRSRLRRYAMLPIAAVSLAGAILSMPSWPLALTSLALGPVAVLALLLPDGLAPSGTASWWEPLLAQPGRLLVATFFALCTIGALLLSLPLCAAHNPIELLDAVFTAVSAVCVTGLIVLDTGRDFSRAGQVAILVLIQVGGLGIMSLTTAALAAFGRRLSLKTEGAVAGLLSYEDRGVLFRALRQLLLVTVVSEGLGALLLAGMFAAAGDDLHTAWWRGLFTAVSAFCNSGFALQSDSLIPYQTSAGVLHVVAALIVLGGLSPPVIAATPNLLRRRHVGLHAKLVLTTTAVLLVGGAVAIAAFEWDSTLAGLSIADKLHNAWFQSVTTRTAGFNSVDIAAVRSPTVWLMILLMFVGGSPGSTAGGIKTTTLAVMVIALLGVLRGRVGAFGRRLSPRAIQEAVAIGVAAVLVALFTLFALLLTQPLSSERALFEVISALGTVGLSMDVTPTLDGVGKVVIICCMFAGRVGALTLLLVLFGRRPDTAWQLPEDDVKLG